MSNGCTSSQDSVEVKSPEKSNSPPGTPVVHRRFIDMNEEWLLRAPMKKVS